MENFKSLTICGMFILAMIGVLASCATPDMVQVKVNPQTYSSAFEKEAALELANDLNGPPCARDVPQAGCSALRRMILDYGDERAKLRVVNASH